MQPVRFSRSPHVASLGSLCSELEPRDVGCERPLGGNPIDP